MAKSDYKFSSLDFIQKIKSQVTSLIRLCLYSSIILVGLNSCTHSIQDQLRQAEELLSTDPDSSYNILNSIGNPKKQSKYRNSADFPFMMTHTDTLYHYNSQTNKIQAAFTMLMDPNKKGDSYFIFKE